jgi:uncharacterized protein YjiS (DUF1127 family)
MFTFPAPASRIVIAARVAEWRRSGRNELTKLNHEPFGRADARAEAARWFWQP